MGESPPRHPATTLTAVAVGATASTFVSAGAGAAAAATVSAAPTTATTKKKKGGGKQALPSPAGSAAMEDAPSDVAEAVPANASATGKTHAGARHGAAVAAASNACWGLYSLGCPWTDHILAGTPLLEVEADLFKISKGGDFPTDFHS